MEQLYEEIGSSETPLITKHNSSSSPSSSSSISSISSLSSSPSSSSHYLNQKNNKIDVSVIHWPILNIRGLLQNFSTTNFQFFLLQNCFQSFPAKIDAKNEENLTWRNKSENWKENMTMILSNLSSLMGFLGVSNVGKEIELFFVGATSKSLLQQFSFIPIPSSSFVNSSLRFNSAALILIDRVCSFISFYFLLFYFIFYFLFKLIK